MDRIIPGDGGKVTGKRAPPAVAVEPPRIDRAALPPDETGPDQPTEPSRECAVPTAFPDSNFVDKPMSRLSNRTTR